MIKAVDLRKGKTIVHNDAIYTVHTATYVAKGNKGSYMSCKLKGLKDGNMHDVRFNVNDRVAIPFMESKELEYLYQEGENYVLMDNETYDQVTVSGDLFGDNLKFLKSNEQVSATICEGEMIQVELPMVVELEVSDAPPVVKGSTVTNQSKEAILETGAKIKVPPFIAIGEIIRVDTRTGEYMDRAK